MRILMISDVYFPRVNGVSTSIQTFKSELEKLGHEIFLIVPEYGEPSPNDDSLIRINSRKVVMDPEDRMMKFREIIRLLPELRDFDIDLVHIQTPFVAHYAGTRIAKELGVPCIATYHTLFEEYLYHYIPWLPKTFLRWCARKFSLSQCQQLDGIITPSTIITGLLQQYGVTNPMVTVPTGISSEKFAKGDGEAFRRKLNIDRDKKLLLNVSRVAFEKNIGSLFAVLEKTLESLPEAHLVIAGEGPAKKAYIQQVEDMGLTEHVTFVGYLDRDSELIDCYHAADLFVFSSRTETQGLVLLEAMAAGTPVVSLAAMGTKEVLREGMGVRITDGSTEDFSEKIIEVLTDPKIHSALSQSAIRYAEDWNPSRLAQKMSAYYSDIILGQTSGRNWYL